LAGVNWSALTDANRPSTRMALGIVRRRSGMLTTSGDARPVGPGGDLSAAASTACRARVRSSRGARRRRAALVWVSSAAAGARPFPTAARVASLCPTAFQPLSQALASTGRPAAAVNGARRAGEQRRPQQGCHLSR
jgi:hypothetical protein